MLYLNCSSSIRSADSGDQWINYNFVNAYGHLARYLRQACSPDAKNILDGVLTQAAAYSWLFLDWRSTLTDFSLGASKTSEALFKDALGDPRNHIARSYVFFERFPKQIGRKRKRVFIFLLSLKSNLILYRDDRGYTGIRRSDKGITGKEKEPDRSRRT